MRKLTTRIILFHPKKKLTQNKAPLSILQETSLTSETLLRFCRKTTASAKK